MTKLKQKLHGKRYLLLCFLVPLFAMLVVYIAHNTWPFFRGDKAKSVLVLDMNAQYVYFFEKLRQILTEGGSLLYTFGRALGGEFGGIFTYYLSSPFSWIVVLFPKTMITEAILTIILLKCGFCGLSMGIYLHCVKGRRPMLNLIFSVMYALSAYAVVMQSNVMWTDNLICLPLILLGIERIIRYGKFKTYVIFLALSLITSYYIGYMTCIFVALYFFIRYFTYTREERNPTGENNWLNFAKALGRIAGYSIVAIMLSSLVLLSAYYSLSFGKMDFATPKEVSGFLFDSKFFPILNKEAHKQYFDVLPMLSKLFFGSYDTVRPEGMPLMYCGMMTTVLFPLYFFAKSIPPRKKIGAGILMVFFFLGMNWKQLDLILHGGQRPNWLNARFSYMFVFLILVMAYDVFVRLGEIGYGKVIGSCAVAALILIVIQTQDLENMPDFTAVWSSLGLIALYAAVLYFTRSAADKSVTLAGPILAVLVTAEMILSGIANIYAFDKDVRFATRESYREMVDKYSAATAMIKDDSFFRSEKLEHRKPNDNMAIGINGLTNSTSTLNSSVIRLLRKFGLTSRSHWSKYIGESITEDIFFGIKYVYADKEKTPLPRHLAFYYDKKYETEDGIAVYENPYALSPIFTVPSGFEKIDLGDSSTSDPFKNMNEIFAGLLGNEQADPIWKEAEVTKSEHFGTRKFSAAHHDGYEKEESDTSSRVTYTIKGEGNKELYMFIPSDYPMSATVYVGGISAGKYFTDETHGIKELGSFAEGGEIRVDIMLDKEKMYCAQGFKYFYYFDDEAFTDTMEKLKCRSFETDSFRDDRICGTIKVEEGMNTVMTTIPFDEGWIVKANGKKIDTHKALGSLLYFELPAGEYEIELKYRPSWIRTGTVVTVSGIVIFVMACLARIPSGKKKKSRSGQPASAEGIPDADGPFPGDEDFTFSEDVFPAEKDDESGVSAEPDISVQEESPGAVTEEAAGDKDKETVEAADNDTEEAADNNVGGVEKE